MYTCTVHTVNTVVFINCSTSVQYRGVGTENDIPFTLLNRWDYQRSGLLAHEGNTEEENNVHVVFKLNTVSIHCQLGQPIESKPKLYINLELTKQVAKEKRIYLYSWKRKLKEVNMQDRSYMFQVRQSKPFPWSKKLKLKFQLENKNNLLIFNIFRVQLFRDTI